MTAETTQGPPEDTSVPAAAPTTTTPEDVDEALIAEARRLLGAARAATVNRALAELIADRRRREAAESQLRRFAAGQFAARPGPGGER